MIDMHNVEAVFINQILHSIVDKQTGVAKYFTNKFIYL